MLILILLLFSCKNCDLIETYEKIKDSKEGDAFYQQQKNLVDIEDLNDYSKTYHHANPNCLEEPIVSSELQGYCKLLFKVIEKI